VRGGLGIALACVFAAACAADDAPISSQDMPASPIDRLLIGKASKYPADTSLRAKSGMLEANMAERRKLAWTIVEKVLAPIRISATTTEAENEALALPRFQTWYTREEILPMFDRLFRSLPSDAKRTRAPFTQQAINAVFPWNASRATSLASFTEERLEARRQELSTAAGLHSLGKDNRVLLSPDYVAHLFQSYGKVMACANPPDSDEFAPCLDGEFPAAAAAIKTRWMPSSAPIPTYDTSASALREKLARGTFGDGDGQADPDETSAYTMRLTEDTSVRLVALHIMTKELRDWSWITLWWSPDADSDFGADRPASLGGAFAHYKMCVTTAFDEKDGAPGSAFADRPTLAAALAAADGPATWCSNPYLETQERAAKTNCIGCHQHGGSGETSETILADPERFPDASRTKIRRSFPSDYAFTTEGGLDLAAGMRARAEALTE
jgi:hypothetical protein